MALGTLKFERYFDLIYISYSVEIFTNNARRERTVNQTSRFLRNLDDQKISNQSLSEYGSMKSHNQLTFELKQIILKSVQDQLQF